MNDLRFAACQLLKNPGFTAVVVLTLAAVSSSDFDLTHLDEPERVPALTEEMGKGTLR